MIGPRVHTGRAARTRDYLRANPGWHTARQVIDATDPTCRSPHMLGTLHTMLRSGQVAHRITAGTAQWRYLAAPATRPRKATATRTPTAAAKPKPAPRAKPAAPASKHRATPRNTAPMKTAAAKHAKATATALPHAAPSPAPLATRARKAPAAATANFTAAPGTVDHDTDPKRSASAQIAAHIAAFQARGGRIEQLGPTRIFHVTDTE